MPKFVLLWTDAAVWLLVAGLVAYTCSCCASPTCAPTGARSSQPPALASSMVLVLCLGVTLLDSLHYRPLLPPAPGVPRGGGLRPRTRSVLDAALADLVAARESTYSRPAGLRQLHKESLLVDGQVKRVAPRLKFGGAHLGPGHRVGWATCCARRHRAWPGGLAAVLLCCCWWRWLPCARAALPPPGPASVLAGTTTVPWHVALGTVWVLCAGADRAGHGAVGALPRAGHRPHRQRRAVPGAQEHPHRLRHRHPGHGGHAAAGRGAGHHAAGYFKGWVDELIQYIYTVLSSVPNVLLIAACVLMVQVFLDKHPELFETGAERADLKLFLLCACWA
jgi:peptide/nickel transport system permease protein